MIILIGHGPRGQAVPAAIVSAQDVIIGDRPKGKAERGMTTGARTVVNGR
jgi:predicted dinucleotide-binding enzyme